MKCRSVELFLLLPNRYVIYPKKLAVGNKREE